MARSVPKPPVKAKKSLGQHFLEDQEVLRMMVDTAGIEEGSHVLEIGPGYGTLTAVLAEQVGEKGQVLCVEKDPEARAELTRRLGYMPQIEIIAADIQEFQLPENFAPFRIVANIPYYITTPLLKQFLLEATVLPQSITLLVQKEYAEKACEQSSLGLMLQCFGEPEYVATVPKALFMPPPKVDSAILHLEITKEQPDRAFLKFIQQGFLHPRKKLGKQLKSIGIDPGPYTDKRPEELSLQDWQKLFMNH